MLQSSLQKAKALHRYYRISMFYVFIKSIALKMLIAIATFISLVLLIHYFLIDINELLNNIILNFKPIVIFTIFFISESFLGLLPPELFIAWTSKASNSWFFLFVLASLSYIAGIISFLIGRYIYLIPSIKYQIENKISDHIEKLRKWGGVFVIIGALSPIPHSIISIASGIIKYEFKKYLLWSLFRYLRFIIYAIIIFQLF